MEAKKTVGQATASMVLGILSLVMLGLLTAIPAVICGHMAKKKIKQDPDQFTGEGSALAGLIMGYISIGLNVLVIGFAILAAIAIPLMSGNTDRAMTTEGQAGCTTIGIAAKIHWVENQNFTGIELPTDFEMIAEGDLDGYYFMEEDYVLEALIDGDNYVISAEGGTPENQVKVIMSVVDDETSWSFESGE